MPPYLLYGTSRTYVNISSSKCTDRTRPKCIYKVTNIEEYLSNLSRSTEYITICKYI